MPTLWFLRIFLGLYVIFTILVSLLPGRGEAIAHWDKVGHYLVYLMMAILALLSFKSGRARFICLISMAVLSYGLEWAQSYIPGRSMSFLDGLTNTLGLLTGLAVFHFQRVLHWLRNKSRSE